MTQTRSLFGPLLLVAIGAIWLLARSGNLPGSNLWAFTHIWPYILIVVGLGLILRPYWLYTSILLDILLISGLVLAILFAPQLGWNNPSMIFMFGNPDIYVGPSEAGSGKVITQTREVEYFNTITVSYPAQVTVLQGDRVSVKIEAEDNLLPGLQTSVHANQLEIFYRVAEGRHVNPTRPVKITIVVADLKQVNFESAGDLTLTGIETNSLSVGVSGAGNLQMKDIAATKLSVILSGAGNLTASGETDDFNLTISGFGSFNGQGLHSQTAKVNLSGAGSAAVWVDKELDAQISGAGSVNYYGSPKVRKQISGIGSVNHSGDK